MEQLCISSFLHHGHPFHLYTYPPIQGVPAGALVLDANEILPASKIFMYREVPSYAGFANFFRYKLLLEKGGWFVDADTICLKPFEFAESFVFSSQGSGGARLVNVAAIRCPAGSAPMRLAWETCRDADTQSIRWGQTGPLLITRAVEDCGLQQFVQPPEVFCPVNFPEWEHVLDPLVAIPDTHGIHLWNEMWRRANKDKDQSYHPDCIYEQLKRRYLCGA